VTGTALYRKRKSLRREREDASSSVYQIVLKTTHPSPAPGSPGMIQVLPIYWVCLTQVPQTLQNGGIEAVQLE
jgi:hypothetical protein